MCPQFLLGSIYNTELSVFIGSLEVMLYQTYGLENLVSIAVCTGDTL